MRHMRSEIHRLRRLDEEMEQEGERMSWNPCEFGFECPYKCWTDDDDIGCTYPKLAKDVEEGESVTGCYEADCELMDYDSDLSYILRAYRCKCQDTVDCAIRQMKEEDQKWVEEWREMRKEMKRQRDERKGEEEE